jgi:hypothetical protein
MPDAIYNEWRAITTSDTVDLPWETQAVWVGGAGNVVAVMPNGLTGTFTGVTAGATLPIRVKRINASSTTATNLMALRQV